MDEYEYEYIEDDGCGEEWVALIVGLILVAGILLVGWGVITLMTSTPQYQ